MCEYLIILKVLKNLMFSEEHPGLRFKHDLSGKGIDFTSYS